LRRQEVIKPGYDAFREWAETQHKNVLTKGAIDRALHYAVNQLPLIDPFFEDGRIHLDNNANEHNTTSGAGEEKLLICNLLIFRNYKIGTRTYGLGCGNACQSSGKSASVNCLTFMASGMSMVIII